MAVLTAFLVLLALTCSKTSGQNLFRIGSFNTNTFGDTKAGNSAVMNVLTQIINRYDIIFLQKIKDVDESAIYDLMAALNDEYEKVVSDRLGRSSQEQYAFLYKKNAGIDVTGIYQYNDINDHFDRPPFAVKFHAAAPEIQDFVLLGVRIKPGSSYAANELNHLDEVRNSLVTTSGTSNILILGDLHADCTSVSNPSALDLRNDGSVWLISDTADTMVSSTNCAYERIISWGSEFNTAVAASRVFTFDHLTSNPSSVSIYYPVEVELYTGIKVAAFNIQVFGTSKANNSEVMDTIYKTIRRYDITLVQEIRDISNTAFPSLMNGLGTKYSYYKSARLGRTNSKEEYAFIYRNDRGIAAVEVYQDPDTNDIFERPPYSVRFQYSKNNNVLMDFCLTAIHIKPSDAENEINHLDEARAAVHSLWSIDKSIIMGDMNADCGYLSQIKQNNLDLAPPNSYWPIDTNTDTTVAASSCAYDRFIVSQNMNTHLVAGSAKVFRFDQEYNLNSTQTSAVSDHYPIELVLRV